MLHQWVYGKLWPQLYFFFNDINAPGKEGEGEQIIGVNTKLSKRQVPGMKFIIPFCLSQLVLEVSSTI